MTWSINNKEAWDFKIEFFSSFHFLQMFMKICLWEVSSTNLLSDTSCFSCLHICLSQLIKDQCFARIYVPHYTDNWTSKFFLFGLLSTTFLQFLEFFYLCSFPLDSVLLWVLNVIKSRWSISFFCFFLLCTLLCLLAPVPATVVTFYSSSSEKDSGPSSGWCTSAAYLFVYTIFSATTSIASSQSSNSGSSCSASWCTSYVGLLLLI